MEILKVSSGSRPGAVAGAIANSVRGRREAMLQMIGPRAVNQAVKAVAIARSYLAASGIDLYFTPAFATVSIEEEDRTAIQFELHPRHSPSAQEAAND